MNNQQVKLIANMLQASYNGEAWAGANLVDLLTHITNEQAYQKPIPDAHSIWELVLHITAWRNFALQKLIGNDDFSIKLNSPQDWALITDSSFVAWQGVLQDLAQNQNELLKALENTSDEKLSENVPHKHYNFYTLLQGIIQHDVYHLGQMSYLKKMLNS